MQQVIRSLVPNTELPAERDAMFRISLIVCVSLIFGITAKPWNELPDEANQKAVMSVDDDGKLSWAVEVEPPEEMDKIHYEIDPSMKIWKNMRGIGRDKKYLKAEEDLDELYHPSLDDLPQGRIQNMDVLPVAEIMEKYDINTNMKKAKEDESKARVYLEPEEDMDALYHKDPVIDPFHQENVRAAYAIDLPSQKKHTEPEEDLDGLYHR